MGSMGQDGIKGRCVVLTDSQNLIFPTYEDGGNDISTHKQAQENIMKPIMAESVENAQ